MQKVKKKDIKGEEDKLRLRVIQRGKSETAKKSDKTKEIKPKNIHVLMKPN